MQCVNQKELWLSVCGVSTLVSVPCGKCIPCLMNKRSDWSFRLEQEHRVSKSAYFVTLTYDQKHLRTDGSLEKRDLQLYLKRLRKNESINYGNVGIRYYAVGEYGSNCGRPHYHILLFNASSEGNIRSAWSDSKGKPIGIVHIGKVTAASIAYCTKYIIQKDSYPEGVQKPFATMSRAYGIGAHYLSDTMVEYHRLNDANYVSRPGNVRGRLPRFFREKIWYRPEDRKRISDAAMALVKENRRLEDEYYALTFGSAGEARRLEARDRMLARVKQKVKFSQTF